MDDKQQVMVIRMSIMEPLVVEGCDDRLSRSRGSHDEVTETVMDLTGNRKLVEDLFLFRTNHISCQHSGALTVVLMLFGIDSASETLLVIGFKVGAVPIGIKGCQGCFDDLWVLL